MREIEAKIGEFVERKVSAEDQLKRTTLCATRRHGIPIGGSHGGWSDPRRRTNHDDCSKCRQTNGRSKVNPQDIDKVQLGQTATLRFTAFNIRTTPEIFVLFLGFQPIPQLTSTRTKASIRSELPWHPNRLYGSVLSNLFRGCRSRLTCRPENAQYFLI